MSDGTNFEKIDLDKVDWRGSREFFESLGEALDKLDDKDEAYDFTWVGKRKSIIEAGAPINKTFRPDVEASKNWDTYLLKATISTHSNSYKKATSAKLS